MLPPPPHVPPRLLLFTKSRQGPGWARPLRSPAPAQAPAPEGPFPGGSEGARLPGLTGCGSRRPLWPQRTTHWLSGTWSHLATQRPGLPRWLPGGGARPDHLGLRCVPSTPPVSSCPGFWEERLPETEPARMQWALRPPCLPVLPQGPAASASRGQLLHLMVSGSPPPPSSQGTLVQRVERQGGSGFLHWGVVPTCRRRGDGGPGAEAAREPWLPSPLTTAWNAPWDVGCYGDGGWAGWKGTGKCSNRKEILICTNEDQNTTRAWA